jgi:hypothetical protein
VISVTTQLKNIAEPIRIYSLEVGTPVEEKPASPADPAPSATPSKRAISAPLAAGIVALLLLAAAAGTRLRNVALSHPRPRISQSSYCHSPIFRVMQAKNISPTCSPIN